MCLKHNTAINDKLKYYFQKKILMIKQKMKQVVLHYPKLLNMRSMMLLYGVCLQIDNFYPK